VDDDGIACPLIRAVDDGVDAELGGETRERVGTLCGDPGLTGDDLDRPDARQIGEKSLRHALTQERAGRVVGEILEWKDRH
jgi:hypothetical protein